ncbi:cytochrome b/b6 domain-containing protein [Paragemmobacter ruber]|uniref:Cytochrome B n=1 Tax=Paragemmobacter ruber TaxID=1985673 RepID=A0ABW9Y8M8_9RHOB|nr:cytochrome b/b6 domain-containing protein [Rhodobacter ruber]NBE08873.1 cytochrome B [Rhodobacter ruber]
MARVVKVWDPLVRLFHWSLVAGFAANIFVTAHGKAAHRWVGYAVAGLIVLRLIWGIVGTRHARLAGFLPRPEAVVGQLTDMATGRRRVHEGHSPLGALMIVNLILTMAGLAASGYAMTTVTFFGVGWVEEVHEMLVVWAEISVVVHVLAVVVESRRLGVNLPKSMVTGYKTLP